MGGNKAREEGKLAFRQMGNMGAWGTPGEAFPGCDPTHPYTLHLASSKQWYLPLPGCQAMEPAEGIPASCTCMPNNLDPDQCRPDNHGS